MRASKPLAVSSEPYISCCFLWLADSGRSGADVQLHSTAWGLTWCGESPWQEALPLPHTLRQPGELHQAEAILLTVLVVSELGNMQAMLRRGC